MGSSQGDALINGGPRKARPAQLAGLNRAAMVDAIADMLIARRCHPLGMAGVMIDQEIAAGRQPIQPGATEPFDFPAADWTFPQVVSLDGREVRLVAILANAPGNGAFRRLIANIRAAGLAPVVIAPVGVVMPAIMERWGWRQTIIGSGWEVFDEWRPDDGRAFRGQQTTPDGPQDDPTTTLEGV